MKLDKKKRKNIDAIASTSYGQILNEHSSFYTIPCTVNCSYSLLLAISIHRILHEILQVVGKLKKNLPIYNFP